MNLTVTKRYVDRFSKEMVYPGTTLKGVPDARAAELIKAGVAEEQKKREKPDKQEPPADAE